MHIPSRLRGMCACFLLKARDLRSGSDIRAAHITIFCGGVREFLQRLPDIARVNTKYVLA
jgi:hypothetical protein